MIDKELQRLATALGVRDADHLSIEELIARIQHQEGDIPCYSQLWSSPCRIRDCPLRQACTSTGKRVNGGGDA